METSHAYPKEADTAPAATTDSVTYEYSLSNNGLLSLYNISMRDSLLGEHGTIITCTDTNGNSVVGSKPGEVNGLARYPDAGLTPTSKIFCSGTDMVSQEEVLTRHQYGFEYGTLVCTRCPASLTLFSPKT